MSRLEMEFAALGLEVYSQNFSATKPLSMDTKVSWTPILAYVNFFVR